MKTLALLLSMQLASGTLTPYVTAEGAQLFTFVLQVAELDKQPAPRGDVIAHRLGLELAAARWCLSGYEITGENEAAGYVVIEGRCR